MCAEHPQAVVRSDGPHPLRDGRHDLAGLAAPEAPAAPQAAEEPPWPAVVRVPFWQLESQMRLNGWRSGWPERLAGWRFGPAEECDEQGRQFQLELAKDCACEHCGGYALIALPWHTTGGKYAIEHCCTDCQHALIV